MNRFDKEGARQDRARTAWSNKSLAKGRRTPIDNPTELTAEQKAYQARFGKKPSPKKICVIYDVDGNYPDTLWTRPD